jgi:hypothetical protein
MNRRGFFAALAAPFVARWRPKPTAPIRLAIDWQINSARECMSRALAEHIVGAPFLCGSNTLASAPTFRISGGSRLAPALDWRELSVPIGCGEREDL